MITPYQNTNRLPFSPTIAINPAFTLAPPSYKTALKKSGHAAPDLPRGLNFYADYSGCGHWRMIWPELLLNCFAKANVQGGTVMIGDKNFYKGLKTIRIQRQATESQLNYIKWV